MCLCNEGDKVVTADQAVYVVTKKIINSGGDFEVLGASPSRRVEVRIRPVKVIARAGSTQTMVPVPKPKKKRNKRKKN